MRVARLLTAGAVVALVVGTAAPALAKGAGQVRLTGGDQVVTVGDPDDSTTEAFSNLVGSVRLYDGVWSDGYRAERPEGDLGPRIVAEWLFIGPDAGDDYSITQHLYPYAQAGPVAHIPPGQVLFGETVREAWFATSSAVADHLAAVGFDAGALDPAAGPPSEPWAATGTASQAMPWLVTSALIVSGAALALFAMMRGREQRPV